MSAHLLRVERELEPGEPRVLDVLIVDDNKACAVAVASGLMSSPGIRVTCTVASMPDALSVARRLRPDVVLLDATLRDGDAVEATRRLCAVLPRVQVLVTTLQESPAYEKRVLEAGARALLGKPDLGVELDKVLAEIRRQLEEENVGMVREFHNDEVTRDLGGERGRGQPDYFTKEQLERVQRLELSAVLAAGLAHDLASPISTLKVSLSALGQALHEIDEALRTAGGSTRVAAAVARGRSAATSLDEVSDFMHRMTRDFVRFARGGTTAGGRGDVRGATETAVRYTRTSIANRASLALRVARDLPVAVAERTLVRVISNLILNASDAFPGNDAAKNWIVITAERAGRSIHLDITDNAGGVLPEVRPNLFVPLVSSKKGPRGNGLGLGLAVSRALLREVSGDLILVATGPAETRFRCILPVVE